MKPILISIIFATAFHLNATQYIDFNLPLRLIEKKSCIASAICVRQEVIFSSDTLPNTLELQTDGDIRMSGYDQQRPLSSGLSNIAGWDEEGTLQKYPVEETKDEDWYKLNTTLAPNNTDSMSHDGPVIINNDSSYYKAALEVNQTSLSEGFVLRNRYAGEDAFVKLSAAHNAPIGAPRPFLLHYPGNIPDTSNNTVVPYVLHAHYGGNPVGFNEAQQSDYVYFFGINPDGFPTYNPGIGGLGVSMESYYDALDATTGRQEFHIVHTLPGGLKDGSGGRFVTYQGFENELLGSSLAIQTGRDDVSQSSFALRTQEGDDRVVFDWGAKVIRVKNEIGIGFEEGNVPAISQDGVEVVRVDANSNVALANETYVFETSVPNIHTNGNQLAIGSDINPISGGLLSTSTNGDLLRLKQAGDPSAETFYLNKSTDNFHIGTTGGQTSVISIHKNAPANTLALTADGQILNGGLTSGYGKIVAGGVFGGIGFAVNGISSDDATGLYVNGNGGSNVYAFRTDLNATNKVIGRLKNYVGDVEINVSPANVAGKTGVVKYDDAVSNWQTGISRTTSNYYIYSGGDKLSGGLSVAEFTKTGRLGLGATPQQTLHVQGTVRITGSDGTATAPMGRDADGDISAMGEGWGINYSEGNVEVDSSQVTTKYDVASGFYLPVVTNVTNTDVLPIPTEAQYMKVLNVVTVSGRINIDPAVDSTLVSFDLSLPFGSVLSMSEYISGTGHSGTTWFSTLEIKGNTNTNCALFRFIPVNDIDLAAHNYSYTFTYRIN